MKIWRLARHFLAASRLRARLRGHRPGRRGQLHAAAGVTRIAHCGRLSSRACMQLAAKAMPWRLLTHSSVGCPHPAPHLCVSLSRGSSAAGRRAPDVRRARERGRVAAPWRPAPSSESPAGPGGQAGGQAGDVIPGWLAGSAGQGASAGKRLQAGTGCGAAGGTHHRPHPRPRPRQHRPPPHRPRHRRRWCGRQSAWRCLPAWRAAAAAGRPAPLPPAATAAARGCLVAAAR